jgi:hypothetical protein
MAVSGNNNNNGVSLGTTTQQYGVYFDTAPVSANTYILFHDLNANGKWDGTSTDAQIGAAGTIDKRFIIKGIVDVDGNDITGSGSHTGYTVSFVRPNFDAKFNDTVDAGYETVTPVYIDIAQVNTNSTSTGAVRRVEIGSTGEISVTSYPQ